MAKRAKKVSGPSIGSAESDTVYPDLEPPEGGAVTPTPKAEIIMEPTTGKTAAIQEMATVAEGITVRTEGLAGYAPPPRPGPGSDRIESLMDVHVGQNVLFDGRIPAVVLGLHEPSGQVVIRTNNMPEHCTHFSVKPDRLVRLVEPVEPTP